MDKPTQRRRLIVLVVLAALAILAAVIVWSKLSRDVPQPKWWIADRKAGVHPDLYEFLYGSVGAERTAGVPYWIWLVLPRMFHEYVPGTGGYAAFGRPWEEGKEMPAGFSKKTVGYVRVAGNCALCHATYHLGPFGGPVVEVAGPGQTTDVQPLLSFFAKCAKDPRFNADDLMAQINQVTKLSLLDRLTYRYLLIPRTREKFLHGDSVMLDEALRRHRENPHAPSPDERKKAAAWPREQR